MTLHLIKGFTQAFSLTLALLAIVYTEQSRVARDTAPKRIGEDRVQHDFLVEYTETRREMLLAVLRENFPDLDLPAPKAEPANSLSLQALQDRTLTN